MKSIFTPLFGLFTILPLSVGHLLAASPWSTDGIAAVVNDQVITFSDVAQVLAQEKSVRKKGEEQELDNQIKALRLQVLQKMIERQLIIQDFRRREYVVPSSIVKERCQDIITRQFGGNKVTFTDTLQDNGLSFDEYCSEIEENLIIQFMRHQFVTEVAEKELIEKGLDPQELAKTPKGEEVMKEQSDEVQTSWISGLRAEAYIQSY